MHRVTNAATKWRASIGGGGFTKEALSVYDVKIPGGEQAGASVASELLEALAATQVRLGESLAHYTHLGIGGQADILVLPSTARHVQWTVECANRYKVPFLVMGNGSNTCSSETAECGESSWPLSVSSEFADAETLSSQRVEYLLRKSRHSRNRTGSAAWSSHAASLERSAALSR